MINEFGEIRLQQFTLSKSLEHLRHPLHLMLQSLEKNGHRQPGLMFIDNIKAEANFFENTIPSLKRNVHHIAPPSIDGLTAAQVPAGYEISFVPRDEIEQACEIIKRRLDRQRAQDDCPGEIPCGFDVEWPPAKERGGKPGAVATIQMAFEFGCFVFQVRLRILSHPFRADLACLF